MVTVEYPNPYAQNQLIITVCHYYIRMLRSHDIPRSPVAAEMAEKSDEQLHLGRAEEIILELGSGA